MSYAQIFQLLGMVSLAAGLGAMINPSFYKRLMDDSLASLPSLFLVGLATVAGGFLLAVHYATKVFGWQMIIPVLGWLAIIKGLFIIILPNFFVTLGRGMVKNESMLVFWSGIILMLGIGLLALGFWAL